AAAPPPTIKLRTNAAVQRWSAAKARYHRNDQAPVGGVRKESGENDTHAAKRSGASKPSNASQPRKRTLHLPAIIAASAKDAPGPNTPRERIRRQPPGGLPRPPPAARGCTRRLAGESPRTGSSPPARPGATGRGTHPAPTPAQAAPPGSVRG